MSTFIVQTILMNQYQLHQLLGNAYRQKLYVNDFTPGRLDAHYPASTNFVEATATGYAAADVSGQAIADPQLYDVDANGTAYKDLVLVEFTCTADSTPQDVYGWWIEDPSGNVIAAQRGDGPFFPIPFYRAGDKVQVHVRFTAESYGPPPPPAP